MESPIQEYPGKGRRTTIPCAARLAASLLLCAAVLGCKHFYPETASRLRPWLVGKDGGRTAAAFSRLVSSVEGGAPLGRAAETFYAEMTADAAPS